MAVSDAELAQRLREVGEGISDISSSHGSSEELMKRLQIAENLLAHVEQGPANFVLEALLPSTRALISEHLVRHSEIDVKVSVAACITEILRISAPETPFTDEQMKDIFRLTIVAFDCLSPPEGFRYNKAKSILGIVSKIRLCVILLDLECNALIAEIFKHFFRHVGPNHPETVVTWMEEIMEMVIDECEVLPSGVLGVLLSSVRKDTQRISPVASKLGEKIISKYASFLESYVVDAVENNDILLDDYSDIVASIHQKAIEKTEEKNNGDKVVTKSSGLCPGFLLKYFSKTHNESLSAEDEEKDVSETERELNEIMPMPDRYTVKSKIKRVNDLSEEEKTDPENTVSKPDSALTLEKEKRKNVYSRKKGNSDRSCETNDDLVSDDDDDSLKRKRSVLSEEDDDSELKDEKTPKALLIRLKAKVEEKKRGRLSKSGLSSKSKKATPKAKSTAKSEAAKRRKRCNSDLKVKGSASQKKKKGSESIFKRARVIGKEEDPESPELGESLVGRSIMVWWPLDKMFYEGVVVSYDDVEKKHKIDYVDGDVEILDLKKETYHLMEPGQKTDLDMLDISSPISPEAGKEDMAVSSSESLIKLKGKRVPSLVKGKQVQKLNQEKEAKADLSSKSNRGKGYLKMKNVPGKQVKKPVGKKRAKPVSSSKRNQKKADEETESDEVEPAKTVLSRKSSSEKEQYDASMEDDDMIISDGSSEDTAKTDAKGKEVASENPDTEFGAEECAGKLVEMKNGEKTNRWGCVYTSRRKKGGAKK